jgi:hypothetical protein
MTTSMDEDRVGAVMRDMLQAGAAPAPPVDPSELRRGAHRRSLRRVDAKVVVALAAVAAVLVALIVAGPLRSDNRPTRSPTAGHPTSTTTSTTTSTSTTTTTPPPTTVPAGAAPALDTYVADEAATDSEAATASGVAAKFALTPFVSVHSAPVADDGHTIAVAAFSYDPGGHPVQILQYEGGQWTALASLAGPTNGFAPLAPTSVVYLTAGPVAVADVTGDGQPDFLVMSSAADNVPGFVVSQVGGTWHYLAFSGPDAPEGTYVLGRSPQFNGNTLVSDYNNCVPDCASGQNSTIVWTYQPSTGEFTAPDPPGYITPTTTAGGS